MAISVYPSRSAARTRKAGQGSSAASAPDRRGPSPTAQSAGRAAPSPDAETVLMWYNAPLPRFRPALLVALLACLCLACSGTATGPGATASRTAPPRAARTPPYTGPHPEITGHWVVTSFTEQEGDVYTC